MKSGASDPFADGVDEEPEDDADPVEDAETENVGDAADVADAADAAESSTAHEAEASPEAVGSVENQAGEGTGSVGDAAEELAEDAVDDELDGGEVDSDEIDRSDIPWVLRRDTVKDDRPHVHQLFVREDTDGRARRAESRLEERLGTDVYRLDAREAMYLVGMQHLDEVVELLEEWGYDL